MKKIISLLLVLLNLHQLCLAQQNYWFLTPNKLNMNVPQPGASPTTPTTYTSSNAIFDANNNIVFSVVNGSVYDSGNNLVASLPNGNTFGNLTNIGGTEVNIVPVPGSPMSYYVIYEGTVGNSTDVLPMYVRINVQQNNCLTLQYALGGSNMGTVIQYDPNSVYDGELLNGKKHIGMAVSKSFNSSGDRYLYLVTAMGVNKCTITTSGISTANRIVSFMNGYVGSDPTIMDVEEDVTTIEADLAPNGRFLAWSRNWGSLGLPVGEVSKIELNVATGNYIYGSGVTYPMYNPTGVEFRQVSKGNSMLYIVDGVDILKTNVSLNQQPYAIGYSCAAPSHLEMAKNGKMYGIMPITNLPPQSPQTKFFTIDNLDQISTEPPFYIDSHYSLGYAQVAPYTLPEQIDGDNFSMAPIVVTMGASINSIPLIANTNCNTTINFNYNTPLLLTSNFNPSQYVPTQYRIKIDKFDPSDGCAFVENIHTGTWINYNGSPTNLSTLMCNNNHSFNLLTGSFKITYEVKNSCGLEKTFTSSFNVLPIGNTDFGATLITPNANLHQRFEFGMNIPSLYNAKIINFLNDYDNINRTAGGNNINPYDPDQIKVEAIFINPNNITVKRYGFYYKDVIPATAIGNYPNASYNSNATELYKIKYANSPFRVRIAPDVVGTWQVTIKLIINNIVVNGITTSFTFNVLPNNKLGPIALYQAANGSKRYFKNSNGDDFFLIGKNINVPPLDRESDNQPTQTSTGNVKDLWPKPCGIIYKAYTSMSPVTGIFYRGKLQEFANNKGNFTRIRMDADAQSIEWAWKKGEVSMQLSGNVFNTNSKPLKNCVNDYDHRQNHAWELDKTIETCEQSNIYVALNLFNDFEFWSQEYEGWSEIMKVNAFWHKNPYSSLLETYPFTGSGPYLADNTMSDFTTSHFNSGQGIIDFFHNNSLLTNPPNNLNIFNLVKKRLFYINARYGYSPNIAMWEVMNETDNIGRFPQSVATDTPMYKHLPSLASDVTRWVLDVNNELKSYYPKKIVMNGFGNATKANQAAYHNFYNGDTNNGIDYIDIASRNDYYANVWDNAKGSIHPNFKTDVLGNANTEIYKNHNSIAPFSNQPFIIGEIDAPPIVNLADKNTNFHIQTWASCFSGQLGTALGFWAQFNEANNYEVFNGVHDFFSSVNLNGNEWYSYRSRGDNGIPNVSCLRNPSKVIDNYYMTNAESSASEAIGWFHNYSYNWRAMQLRGDFNSPILNDPNLPNEQCTVLDLAYQNNTSFYTTFPDLVAFPDPINYFGAEVGCDNSGPYQINTNTNEVTTKVKNMIPFGNYTIAFYDPYLGGHIQGSDITVQADGNGVITFYKALYDNVNSQTKEYPNYAYKITQLGARDNNTEVGLTEKQLERIENNLLVYPNPNSGNFTVKFNGLYMDDVYDIKVLDVLGRIVKHETNLVGDINKEISIDKNVKGLYLVNITSKKGIKLSKKIVVE